VAQTSIGASIRQCGVFLCFNVSKVEETQSTYTELEARPIYNDSKVQSTYTVREKR